MKKFCLLLIIGTFNIGRLCTGAEIICDEPNEFYNCGSACQTTCDKLGEICPIINVRCNDLCYCIDGCARNGTGNCIPIKDCPQKDLCKKANEHFDCGSACQTTCKTLGEPCKIQNVGVTCNQGCYCDDGFARDKNGKCIPISDCPPKGECLKCAKPHEHFACGSPCQTTCDTLGKPCPIVNVKCTEACYCDCGYARDKNNECILIENCPRDSYQCNDGPNEQFGCGPCDTECTTLGKRCGKEKGCYPGCYCKPGFARDENKRCIHIDKCHQFYRTTA